MESYSASNHVYSGKKVKSLCEIGSCISMLWIIKSHLSLKWSRFLGTDRAADCCCFSSTGLTEMKGCYTQLPPLFLKSLWCDRTVQDRPLRAVDTHIHLILLILLFLFYLCYLPFTCSDLCDVKHKNLRQRESTYRQARRIELCQWTGTWLDIVLIDISNNFPSLVWWSLCTKALSWNEPGTLSVTHRASCSLRHNSPANRSFACTLIFVEWQNSFTRGSISYCILYLCISTK